MNLRNCTSLVFSVLLLTACANNLRQKTAANLAAYTAAAGPEVSSFSMHRELYSWQALGNQTLVVYTQPQQAYLLDVSLCPDLPTASGITLSRSGGQIMSKVDKVLVGGSEFPCPIQHIRPVDLDKLRATQAGQPKI
ncbi:MAG: DUF6491 family protein [Gammaproteobacteria bacterium]